MIRLLTKLLAVVLALFIAAHYVSGIQIDDLYTASLSRDGTSAPEVIYNAYASVPGSFQGACSFHKNLVDSHIWISEIFPSELRPFRINA